MLFTSTKNNLVNALHMVSGLAGGKSAHLPILNNILIRAQTGGVKLIATNLEIGISTTLRGKVDSEGEFTIPSKTFVDFINTLPEENVKIEQSGTSLSIVSKTQRGKLRGVAPEDFPLIPSIEKGKTTTITLPNLIEGLEDVIPSIAVNETRPEISGCLFWFNGNELTLVGTDSFRLAEKKIELKKDAHTGKKIIVPLKTIQEVLKIANHTLKNIEDAGDVQISLTENQILFIIGPTEVTSRLIEGTYPDYRQIIPEKVTYEAIVSRDEFIRAVKSASIFSEINIFDVMLKSKGDVLTVFSSSSQSGEGEAEVSAKITGGDFTLVLNGRYLTDGLLSIGSNDISFGVTSHETPCVLKPYGADNYLYIIMPIRQ